MSFVTSTHTHGESRSDAELFAAADTGDDAAFRTLFDRHVDAIRAYAAARIGADAADDVVVETFAVAWRRRSEFRTDATTARPWLYGIATTLLRSHHAHERRWQELQRRAVETRDAAVEQPELADANSPVAHAIAQLSPSEREVLLLVAIGDLTIAEAARSLGIRPVAARMRLHRARRAINAALDPEEER